MDKILCHLGHISYEIGEQKNIENLPFFQKESELLEIFQARGLRHYSESNLRPHELAKLVLQRSLEQSDIRPNLIDCVVIATDSFWDESAYSRTQMNHTMNELGLTNAYPIGISMLECTSSSIALQVASNLIYTKKANNVLVVCTNKVKPGHDNERIIQPGISILSDAAAACILSSEKKLDFELLTVEQSHSSFLENLNPEENFEDFVQGSVAGFAAVAKKVFHRLNLDENDFQWLITNNYLPHIIMMFANKIGFQSSKCFLNNIPRFAHAHTADTLINLKDCSDSGSITTGSKLLLLSNSPTSWGAVALKKIAN